MEKKDDTTPSELWARRQNSNKLNLSTSKYDRNDTRENHDSPSAKRFGSMSSKTTPLSAGGNISSTSVASPTASGASSAFGLGMGAFASFGSASKTPKTPGSGSGFDFSKGMTEKKESQPSSDNSEKENSRRPPARKSLSSLRTTEPPATSPKDSNVAWPLRYAWVMHYRPPTSKNSDYEKSIVPRFRFDTVQGFFTSYAHLRRPSALPTVSDYHFFKEGIRPVWEDEENKNGGKWVMRLKKGVADRYWEELLFAMIGDQFAEASEEVCGAVVSVRSGEDVFSIWTKNDGGRNVKIRETIKRVLSLPPDTSLQFISHDKSIEQRIAVDQAREQKAGGYGEKRRNTLSANAVGKEEAS